MLSIVQYKKERKKTVNPSYEHLGVWLLCSEKRKVALSLPRTFVFSCLPCGFWPLIWVYLITKALKGTHSGVGRGQKGKSGYCLRIFQYTIVSWKRAHPLLWTQLPVYSNGCPPWRYLCVANKAYKFGKHTLNFNAFSEVRNFVLYFTKGYYMCRQT